MMHVDALGYWIAVVLVDDGHDPDWVRMVMQAKGHGDIDLDEARAWLLANPKGCRCQICTRRWRVGPVSADKRKPAPPVQMVLI